MEFSINYVFGIIALGCVLFILQMLVEHNAQRSQLAPRLTEIRQIKERQQEELEKVQRLTEEAQPEASAQRKELDVLEARLVALNSAIEAAEKDDESEQ